MAIDTHVHLESEAAGGGCDVAARGISAPAVWRAIRRQSRRTTSRMACVVFSVDERLTDVPGSNETVARFAANNPDVAIAFATSIRTEGADGVCEAWCVAGLVHGLKSPARSAVFPNDRLAYPLYEVFAEARLPVLFHTGHSGIGTGMPGGGGIRLKYGNPMPIDDVAVDFPEMPIIMAHPSFPWQDEAISICLHKPTVYIDLSGWSPNTSRRRCAVRTRC